MKKELSTKKTSLEHIAWVLVVSGSLNWLLIGVFNFNIVEKLFRDGFLAKVIYMVIGAAAIYLVMGGKDKCLCGGKGCALCTHKDSHKEDTDKK